MGASPVAVLIIIGIYVTVYAAIQGSSSPSALGLDSAPTTTEPATGFFDILASIISSVWGVVLLILGAIVFNVDGAPFFVRVPVAIAIIGSLSWSVATLIRGN